MFTFSFSLLKLGHLIDHKNPIITTNEEKVDAEEIYSLGSEDFMMAFTLDKYEGGTLYDPRYIKWVTKLWNKNAQEANDFKYYPLHRCTDDELSKFELEDSKEGL